MEKQELRVFENKVLSRIFGSNKYEIIGDQRKLHSVELHNLCSRTDIIRMIKSGMRLPGLVARMGEKISAFRDLVGKRGRNRPQGIPVGMRKDNIKIDFREIDWNVDWIRLV
jgi:hypothetical protein